MTEKEFVDGMIFKTPHEKAPDFIKAKMSIKRAELIAWLNTKSEDWINLNVKEAKSGKWYAEVDTWKPTKAANEAKNHDANYTLSTDSAMTTDEIPF